MNISLEIILAALLTLFVVQSIKLATDRIKGNFNLKSVLTTYGGMPSSHAALVTSLCTIIAFEEGLDTIAFGMAAVFSIIIIADAMIFRGYVDRNTRALKKLIERFSPQEQKEFLPIVTKLKHSFPQILVGMIIGFVIASLIQLL